MTEKIKGLYVRIPEELKKEAMRLALETESSLQQIVIEGLEKAIQEHKGEEE